LLQQEVSETEASVQQLIASGLSNFSSRLVELDVAVKTPLELLSTSTHLADKKHELENKVLNMEVEVCNLEEKYRNMVRKISPTVTFIMSVRFLINGIMSLSFKQLYI